MIEAITADAKSASLDLNELRKMLMSSKEESKLSSKTSEESPKKLSDREIEKEILLSSDSDIENSEEIVSEEETVPTSISVDAGASGIASTNSIGYANVGSNTDSSSETYNEEMDYNGDGVVTNDEIIRYYSEKYATLDSKEDIESEVNSAIKNISVENTETAASNTNSATNPIQETSAQSLMSKMMMTYGVTPQIAQSNLQVLV